jgi:uncharacterized protein YkwD
MDPNRRWFLFTVLAACPVASAVAARSAAAGADVLGDAERTIASLTNRERAARKRPAVAWSDPLAQVARNHSRDMLRRRYFDHRTPEGLGPADRLTRAGISFRRCEENIFSITGGPTAADKLAAEVVDGWMNSRGHRRNMLDADVRRVGVGAAATGRTVVVTQLFAG